MALSAWVVTILFYCFSAVLLASGVMVVMSRNAVRSVLFLILAFFACSALWIILEAEFLALILLFVYVGAVMTLFLFMIMMLDVDRDQLKSGMTRHFFVGVLVIVVAVVMMVLSVGANELGFSKVAMPDLAGVHYSNARDLAKVLYTEYVYPFELAGVLLLLGMISAITLTHRQQRNSKKQKPSEQIRVRRNDRVRMIKMKSEKKLGED
jgi:NADH-quinone oxidoreductase subunit J